MNKLNLYHKSPIGEMTDKEYEEVYDELLAEEQAQQKFEEQNCEVC